MELFDAAVRVMDEVQQWKGVTVRTDRMGGTDLFVGRRIIGHVRDHHAIDVLLAKSCRDDVVSAGLAEPHPVLTSSGWVRCPVRTGRAEEIAVQVLRRAYDEAKAQLNRTRAPFLAWQQRGQP